MLKAYALGLLSAALAVVLVAVIWFGVQPKQERGLVWGDSVYTTKQEFNGYLKSKGLSYKTWLARNPGAAPWEPDEVTIGAITVHVSNRADSVVRPMLAAIGLTVAAACALLLLRRERPLSAKFASVSVASFSAVLVAMLIGIWFATQPRQEPGLLWGGTVYHSKQEFNTYLKSKGLSYKTWVARNPGAAPWEPATVRVSAKAPSASAAPEARADWMGRPLIAGIGLMLAAGCAVLLLRGRRPALARLASGSGGSVASIGPGAVRIGKSATGVPTLRASTRRVGVVAAGATGRVKVWVPLYGASVLRGLGVVASGTAGYLKAKVPLHGKRLAGAGRVVAWRLAQFMRERDISAGNVALGLLGAVGSVLVALMVIVFLSSL